MFFTRNETDTVELHPSDEGGLFVVEEQSGTLKAGRAIVLTCVETAEEVANLVEGNCEAVAKQVLTLHGTALDDGEVDVLGGGWFRLASEAVMDGSTITGGDLGAQILEVRR